MTTPEQPTVTTGQPSRRLVLALAGVVATLALAVGAALLTSDAGWLNITIDRFAGESQGVLGDVGTLLPLGFAFAAGMVSTVNPCGFPLLPTYLGLFLSEDDSSEARGTVIQVRRALAVGGTVTVSFVLLFAAVGLPIALGASVIVDTLPYIALSLGVVLVLVGGYRIAGGSLYSALPERLAARLAFGRSGTRSYFMFGLAYGLASLSCTLPIFLSVVGFSVTTGAGLESLGSLALYGVGMGTVIIVLTVTTAVFKTAVATRLRRVLPYIDKVGTVALFAAGAYLVYYWLTIGGLLAG